MKQAEERSTGVSVTGADAPVNLGKLKPPGNANVVPRLRLYARLDASGQQRMIVVTAPAGYGKTTLLTGWLAARPPQIPAAWLTLTPDDNEPVHFWSHLCAAPVDWSCPNRHGTILPPHCASCSTTCLALA
jgi:ATP/maltotriose-dependent transcriptional regulator MalT